MLYESDRVRVGADDGTATLWLDFPGDGPNPLTPGRVAAIGRALDAALGNPFVELLVVCSAKPAGFCGGIDPDAWAELTTDADRRAFAAAGQQVFGRLAAAPFPTLAFLDGPCHGAGLELALACDYRLAVATPTTTLGSPEIDHGLLPCWGGITRLTRLLGPRPAAELLAGFTVTAKEALAVGLVDHAFSARRARIELRSFLDRLQLRPRKPRRRRGWFDGLRAKLALQPEVPDWVENHYPARTAALRVLRAAVRSEAAGLAAERSAFAAVPAAAGLDLLRSARRPPVVVPVNPVPPFPQTVGLVGTDETVVALAGELALRGPTVLVEPGDDDRFDRLDERLRGEALAEIAARGRATPLEREQAANRIRLAPAARWAGFDRAGLVVVSDGGATRIAEIEAHVGRRAVLALVGRSVRDAQDYADFPGRIVGLGPPAIPGESDLIEIGRGPLTSSDAVAAVAAWARAFGLTPVAVTASRRLVARRVLAAYWDEAVRLVAEGVPIDAIDAAATAAGLGRGPLETLDGLGLGAVLPLVPRVRPLVAAGLTGRPVGDGFYHLPADNPAEPNVAAQVLLWDVEQLRGVGGVLVEADIPCADRFVYRAVNEAAACLGDERYAGPAEIDLTVAAGGRLFRPHGGPLRFADAAGLPAVVRRLAKLAKEYGSRFAPHPELARRAVARERFYDGPPARRRAAA